MFERIMARVELEPNTGCWLWTGCTAKGYGKLYDRRRGRTVGAHRAMYEWCIGPIPSGMLVCHRCDTRHCVNPEHLFLGTPRDNMQDMMAKGRGDHGEYPMPGEANPNSKLTAEQVLEIRARYPSEGLSMRELAREYGVVNSLISNIVHRKRWAHLPEPKPTAEDQAWLDDSATDLARVLTEHEGTAPKEDDDAA